MNNLKFSIVTPCWNAERHIKETIESVLYQDYDNYEYIIIDGGSQDNTLQIIESYRSAFEEKNIELKVVSEKDNGIFDAMNKGILLAQGDFVGIVNSDDYYERNALSSVNDYYAVEKFDVVFADLRIFDEKGSFIKTAKLDKKFKKRHWNHPTMFVDSKVYSKRLYDNKTIFDDLDYILWCIKQRYKIKTLNKVISNFRLGGVSSQKSWKKSMERVKLANKIYKQNDMRGYALENFLIELIKFFRV